MRKILIFTMIIMLLMSSSVFANNFTSVRVDAGQLGQINRIETRAKSIMNIMQWSGYALAIKMLDMNIGMAILVAGYSYLTTSMFNALTM